MALKGKAKTDYQREYMRKRRLEAKNKDSAFLTPKRTSGNARGCPVKASVSKTPVRPMSLNRKATTL